MGNRGLTSGKIRRLQTAASPAGVFRILAIDHCGVLLRMMDPGGGGNVPAGASPGSSSTSFVTSDRSPRL